MQTWSSFNMFLVLCIWPLRKSELCLFFLLNFLSKFIDMYHIDSLLFLILLVSEMLKIPRTKVEAHFLKKTCFCNEQQFSTRCLRKMSKDNRKPFKIHSSTRIAICTIFLIFYYILQSYLSKWAISVVEMHCPI